MAYYNPGYYQCRILEHGLSESREKKTPYLWIRFEPKDEHGTVGDNPGYDRELQLYLTDKTIDFQLAKLRAIGWTGTSFRELEPGGGSSLRNRIVNLVCTHETVDGKDYERWDFPSVAQNKSEHDKTLAKKLDAMFMATLKEDAPEPAKYSEPVKTLEEVQEEVAGDPDIPF